MIFRADADKKKFDLRRMVGESYRDVIDAADAIGNMNAKAEILLKNFGETKELLEMQPTAGQKENVNSSRKGSRKLT